MKLHPKRFTEEYSLHFQDGETIFKEGDEGREMYIVAKGEVTLLKQIHGKEMTLATLKRGEFFGEMALLESLPRTATAKAQGPTRLLVIQPGGFLLKIRRDPTFGFEMLQALSQRIRTTNEKLLNALSHSSGTESLQSTVQEILETSNYR